MSSWNRHLSNIIALHARGKTIEQGLKFSKILQKGLAPAEVSDLLNRAQEALDLYEQSKRMCLLLKSFRSSRNQHDLEHISHTIDASIRRVEDIIKILNAKARKWGLHDTGEDDIIPSTPPFDMASSADGAFDDESELLRRSIKRKLKDLSQTLVYMETPSLKEIDRLLNELAI